MKTATGKILSSTPISVSKATKIISNFAATDNGASQAVSAYLRRASASFNELKQLHRELRKQSKSDRKHKKSKSEAAVEGAGESSLEPSVFNLTRGAVELSQEASHGYGNSEGKKHKNKKKIEKGEVGNVGDGEGKSAIEDGESKRKKEKNEVCNSEEDEEKMVIEEPSEKKKHKREKSGRKIENFQRNGVKIEEGEMRHEAEGQWENKKKRKSREIGEGIENDSSSEPRKKKIKNEVDS
ncbi:hypothetical protein QQP08_025966 [Theobroma cacao]|nr:hypothetical protein QQP08_025966 [Theobroma cacao]